MRFFLGLQSQFLSAILCLMWATLCSGQDCAPSGHRDINFVVQNNKIVTGVAVLNCSLSSPPDQCPANVDLGWRVHTPGFQTKAPDPLCDPFFVQAPGTFAADGSGLPGGSFVGFDILGDLLYWDGNGTPQFGAVPSHETLVINLGGQNRTIGTGTGFMSGFFFAVVNSSGGLHVHLNFFLQGSDGNSIAAQVDPSCGYDGDGIQATNGLYMVQLQFKSNAGIASSDPVWIVFDNGIGGCTDCEGVVYVGSQIAHDRPQADLNFDRHVDSFVDPGEPDNPNDFARFQTCATGAGVPWTDPCCQFADLDHDGDIDMDDFGIYQRCYSGPNMVADPNCGH